jgi:hypothetical protein
MRRRDFLGALMERRHHRFARAQQLSKPSTIPIVFTFDDGNLVHHGLVEIHERRAGGR